MKISALNRKLHRAFGGRVTAALADGCIVAASDPFVPAAEARREGAHKPSYDLDEYEKYDIFATEK